VPVIPVSLRGGTAILKKGSLNPRPGRMQAVFGAPVDATSYRYETRDDLVSRVRDRIGGALRGVAP
jgi:hypothetical protein